MESRQIYGILKSYQKCGEELISGDLKELRKRQQKSHRLLSLIRTGKIGDFYDAVVKLYVSQSKPIPDILLGLLNQEDVLEFQSKAYAFMSGFIGGKMEHEPLKIESLGSNEQNVINSEDEINAKN